MLRVVLPFCRKDARQMANTLRWAIELDGCVNHNCLVSYEVGTNHSEIIELARRYFKGDVLVHEYSEPPVPGWPAACNWAWQATARYIDDKKVNEPWLWWEADAIPLKPGWLDALYDGYLKGGKPFAGHIVDRMDHMNGVGIYPPDVRRRNQDAMICRAGAWDVVLKPTTTGNCTNLNHLIQHVWNIRPSDGAIYNGDGSPVTFPDWAHVERYMDFNCVLLHRTKDGTLIERLREHREKERVRIESETIKACSTENNVPDHTSGGAVEVFKTEDPINYKAEILIVTYGQPRPARGRPGVLVSDFDWLNWCLRSIRRYCTGFSGITVAFPSRDSERFKAIANEHAKAKSGIKLRVRMFEEPLGKGFLMHQIQMARADELVPAGTNYVVHVDSDCVFKEPTDPREYIVNGAPVYVWRTYDSLTEVRDGKKVVSDCLQWQVPTEDMLGFSTNAYTMTRHPSVFPIAFYRKYREHVQSVHKMSFDDYMLSGRNDHPTNRMDFTSMGAFAFDRMLSQFHWIDISGGNHLAPKDRQKTFWSHGGITPEIESEIQNLIK